MAHTNGTEVVPTLPEPSRPSKGELKPEEFWWRDRQKWLEDQGYVLRARYKPDWLPSWKTSHKPYWKCEDGQPIMVPHILDATRLSDGEPVVLKRILTSQHPYEVEITRFLCSEPLASDSRNHCVRLYDVLDVPNEDDMVVLVLPLLRRYDSPPFETVGEAVDFFTQVLEGLQLMHHHHVAHRDCMNQNIMLDPKPLYPEPYHPRVIDWTRDLSRPVKHHMRTTHPTRYFFIDFGLSRRYDPAGGAPREPPILGGDKSVPEFRRAAGAPCDPFPTDVYYLGNLFREDFLQMYHGVEFMQSLVDDMVRDEPKERPTIDEALSRFQEICASLSSRKLRSRLVARDENPVERVVKGVKHALGSTRKVSHPVSAVNSGREQSPA
ncbi:uncharacterized protein C8Q71DRAFT_766503 [Rhodofomes roseus]|uniref:Protein kinase domain-containing protein n=1 Tax=Rhodofomes roseus TaxID=34475 RepID=A0ABQ8KBX8_9APHY|nr:uncharacterized protein C8Q71DRAFT_766503 [Rhodofomes roseus]KAH9834812.1 hypothetical protein C8Q71DRAFT_766503 [Rhodofomes roseus]